MPPLERLALKTRTRASVTTSVESVRINVFHVCEQHNRHQQDARYREFHLQWSVNESVTISKQANFPAIIVHGYYYTFVLSLLCLESGTSAMSWIISFKGFFLTTSYITRYYIYIILYITWKNISCICNYTKVLVSGTFAICHVILFNYLRVSVEV